MGLDEEAHRGIAYADAYPMAHLEKEPRMAISTRTTYAVDIEDVEYLRHGDTPLLARLFKPPLGDARAIGALCADGRGQTKGGVRWTYQ